jgi:hypothetical protein
MKMNEPAPPSLGSLENVLPAELRNTSAAPRRIVTVRMEQTLLARLTAAAQREHRSVSQEIEHRCAVFEQSSATLHAIIQRLPEGSYEVGQVSVKNDRVIFYLRRVAAAEPDARRPRRRAPAVAAGDQP